MNVLFPSSNVWITAFLIFFVRLLNMALDTVRMLTVMRGMRGLTWVLGVLQTALYVLALGPVVNDLNNPLNIAAYSFGFATGNVFGMMIEKRLAFGYVNMTIISSEKGNLLAQELRNRGHAVTVIPARGKDGKVEVLECSVQRKIAKEIQNVTLDCDPSAFITSRDIQRVWRGYWRD